MSIHSKKDSAAIKLGFMDAGFVLNERRSTPQHMSGLFILKKPKNAPRTYFRDLFEYMRSKPVNAAPFNQCLRGGIPRQFPPVWDVLPDENIDIDYHFRRSALPTPGGELELGLLVSRLHTNPLDLSKPAWEMHLIEGLKGNRFALYAKIHHALMDGMASVKLLRDWFSEDPGDTDIYPIWSKKGTGTAKIRKSRKTDRSPSSPLERLYKNTTTPLRTMPELLGLTRKILFSALNKREGAAGLVPPYSAPSSILNGRVTQRRRVSTQSLELSRFKRLAKTLDCSLNDAVAIVMGTALRNFLVDQDVDCDDKALILGLVASVRTGGSSQLGNAISFLFCDLATEDDSIESRISRVTGSTKAGKEALFGMSPAGIGLYTALLMAPTTLLSLLGQNNRIPPIYNLLLSNLPGTTNPVYFHGSLVERLHPMSVLTDGQALLVTVISWGDRLNFTFIACPDVIPSSQRLSLHTLNALDEVERHVIG